MPAGPGKRLKRFDAKSKEAALRVIPFDCILLNDMHLTLDLPPDTIKLPRNVLSNTTTYVSHYLLSVRFTSIV